jgi:pyruvate dehydrogenase E1 component subunit alpha
MASSAKPEAPLASSQGAPQIPSHIPSKVRAGMGDVTAETVEVWSDADFARATGLLSILGQDGRAPADRVPVGMAPEAWLRIHRGMRLIRLLDERMIKLQREGRIGFYAEARGQEASVIAPVATLEAEDWVVPAHREGGAALFRGLPLATHIAQLFGNGHDIGKGRQMPVNPATPRGLRFLPASWCPASQLPQATGLAWAAKIKGDKTVVLAYLGEGATSAEDFHTGLNFAAVFRVPAVFVCVNNGWALSTPASAQSASETFAVKALAYGMPGVRVDGNDVFALYAATREAVDRARAGGGPTLIEAVTYRLGAHGTSDDPHRYRDEAEVATWAARDPLARLETWLAASGILDEGGRRRTEAELTEQIRATIESEEAVPAPARRSLIEDVYVHPPASLEEQLAELERVRARSG